MQNIKRIAVLTAELNQKKIEGLVRVEKRANSLSAYASTSIEGNPLPLNCR